MIKGHMEDDTDSHFRDLYNSLQSQIENSKRGILPHNMNAARFASQCEIDREYIEMGWERILDRRRRGELTDPSRIEVVEQVAKELAVFHRFPIKTIRHLVPSQQDEDFSVRWALGVMYMGKREDLKIAQWWKLSEKIHQEVKMHPFVSEVYSKKWDSEENELPADYHDRNYDRPGAPLYTDDDEEPVAFENFVPIDPYLRPVATWVVDTWVWDGPPRRRTRRRPGQAP
jgi:hypothetical protein